MICQCLQQLIVFITLTLPTYSMQRLPGVRDQATAPQRPMTPSHQVHFCEQDMEDMFWEIPKQDVLTTLRWALRQVKLDGEDRVTFAIERSGVKPLGRLGTGASHAYSFSYHLKCSPTRYISPHFMLLKGVSECAETV